MRKRNPARWAAIDGRLGRELTVWLTTVRHDGRPHTAPVWFIWLDDVLYFCTSVHSQKYLNLGFETAVTASLPDTSNVIIIEGHAAIAHPDAIDPLADYFYHKYEWDFREDHSTQWGLITVTPIKVLAWGDGYDEAEGTRAW